MRNGADIYRRRHQHARLRVVLGQYHKIAQRVLVEGNHFENCWPSGQNGFCLLLTPRNQNNTAPWSVVQDITIRRNVFVNIAQGINMSGFDAPNKSQRTSRVLIQDNLLRSVYMLNSDGRLFQLLNGLLDVVIDHNTGFCSNAYLVADGASPRIDSFAFTNNIVSHANYGFIGTGTAYANTTLAAFFTPNWTVTHNVDFGGSPMNYPAGSFFPANIAAVGFVALVGWMSFGDLQQKSLEVATIPDPEVKRVALRLEEGANDYLLAHHAYSPRNAMQGLAVYVRAVPPETSLRTGMVVR